MRNWPIWMAAFALISAPAAAQPSIAHGSTEAARIADIEHLSLAELADAIANGQYSSEAIVTAYLLRIAEIDDSGPALNAVIATFPDAIEQARAADAERKAGRYRGPMHGIPILIKDNIEAKGALPTTAGSLALKDNITGRDAPLVAKLREAGAIILGKTNLS